MFTNYLHEGTQSCTMARTHRPTCEQAHSMPIARFIFRYPSLPNLSRTAPGTARGAPDAPLTASSTASHDLTFTRPHEFHIISGPYPPRQAPDKASASVETHGSRPFRGASTAPPRARFERVSELQMLVLRGTVASLAVTTTEFRAIHIICGAPRPSRRHESHIEA